MRVSTEPPGSAKDRASANGGRLPLTVALIALVLAVVGLASWVVYDQMRNSTVDGEIQQLLDDHRAAWMARDVVAFREMTTDDYAWWEVVYENDPFEGFGLAFQPFGGDFDDAVDDFEGNTFTEGALAGWTVEQIGDPIVRVDGPARMVAVNEDWVSGELHALAQSQYVMIEEDGRLKIHHWYFHVFGTYPDV
jgi:hypothetical protein